VPEDKEKYFAETMPEFMGKLEKAIALNAGSGPALVGKTLSLAVCYCVSKFAPLRARARRKCKVALP